MRRLVAVWLSLLALGACGEVRPPAHRASVAVTYRDQIQPLLAARCVSCHGPSQRAALYDLSSYIGVLGPGTDDVRNAVAGDPTSLLLTKLDPATDSQHWGYLLPQSQELKPGEDPDIRRAADLVMLQRWVVQDQLAYFDVLVHPTGWLYPGAVVGADAVATRRDKTDFHGGYLRSNGWNYEACTGCHGSDLSGGTSGRSCTTCHQGGVDSCTTCHGSSDRTGPTAAAPPTDLSWNISHLARGVGAHQAHLGQRTWWAEITCDDCHKVPATVSDPGHLTGSDGHAELTFGARAARLNVSPAYDYKDGTCTVYCHGGAFLRIGQGKVPTWTNGSADAACGTCHAVPFTVGGPDCTTCHQQSVKLCQPGAGSASSACLPTGSGIGVTFLSPGLHGDGLYPLGRAGSEGTCYACHGTKASSGAPGPDLHGATDTSIVTVGLHTIHLTDNAYRKAVPCDTCHVVPSTMWDKGHFDHDLPATVTFSALARGTTRDGDVDYKPTWDRTTALCGNVYCHSLAGGTVKHWKWTATSALDCNSCHGQPPPQLSSGAPHPPAADCKTCHASAYTSSGQLDVTKHINGRVDL